MWRLDLKMRRSLMRLFTGENFGNNFSRLPIRGWRKADHLASRDDRLAQRFRETEHIWRSAIPW